MADMAIFAMEKAQSEYRNENMYGKKQDQDISKPK